MKPDDFAASPFGGLHIVDRRPPKSAAEGNDDDLVARINVELVELSRCHVKASRILVSLVDHDVEVRYDIVFGSDPPMFKCRALLEKEHYYVGQQMGDEMLKFYAMKRPQKFSDLGA